VAVQLKHLPTGIVVKCQATRSREQNREIARRNLSERVEEQLLGDQSRTAIKARESNKKRASKLKKSRRKYKKLAEDKNQSDTPAETAEMQVDSIHIESNDKLDGHKVAKESRPELDPTILT
jgi:peptide chain release factor